MKISGKAILIYLAVAAVASSVLRFFQYVSLFDFSTGFFIRGVEVLGLLIYIALLCFSVVFVALAVLGKKAGQPAFSASSDGMGEKATIPLGIAYLLGAVLGLFTIFDAETPFLAILSAVSTVVFAATGLVLLNNKIPPALIGHVQWLGAIAWFLKTSFFFGDDLIILNHSENLLLLFVYIMMTLYIASSARFLGRVETKASRMREIITAGLTFLASGVSFLGKGMAVLFGGEAVKGITPLNFDGAVALVISLGFLITVFTAEKNKEIEYINQKDD